MSFISTQEEPEAVVAQLAQEFADSTRLAMAAEGIAPDVIDRVLAGVEDFVVNHIDIELARIVLGDLVVEERLHL